MVKAFIFDCYDVLYVASGPEYFAGLKQRFSQHATEIRDLGVQADYGFITQEELEHSLAVLTQLPVGTIAAGLSGGHNRNQPLLDFIHTLRPRFKTALLSNITASSLHDLFLPNELQGLFDEVIISSQVGLLKPSPDIFLLAAQRLGCDTSECVFVDDQPQNCAGAQAVGMLAHQYTAAQEAITHLKQYTSP